MSLRPFLAALMLAATPGLAAVCGIDHSHVNTPASKAPARVPAASGPRSQCEAPTRRATKPAKAPAVTDRAVSRPKEQGLGLCDGS